MNRTPEEQTAWMIYNRQHHLTMLADAIPIMAEEGKGNIVFANTGKYSEDLIDTGLLRWRRGESPLADFHSGMDWAEKLVSVLQEWKPAQDYIIGRGYVWELADFIGFLIGRIVAVPDEVQAMIRDDQSAYAADIALDYILLDALNDRPWRDAVDAPLARLAKKKRQSLAVETYKTYFALLDANGDDAKITPLVAQAESNYKKRERDAFFSGGPTYMGGNGDNPYVVDFMLACVLKKIGWEGDSVHKWVWG